MTRSFVLFGLGVVLSEACRLGFAGRPFVVRALANGAFLVGAWLLMRWLAPA
jgi:hypothetical protein